MGRVLKVVVAGVLIVGGCNAAEAYDIHPLDSAKSVGHKAVETWQDTANEAKGGFGNTDPSGTDSRKTAVGSFAVQKATIPALRGTFEDDKYPLTVTNYDLSGVEHKYKKQQLTMTQMLSTKAMQWSKPTKECKDAWNTQTGAREDFARRGQYMCLPKNMYGINWRPQGIGGSADMLNDDGTPNELAKQNIIVVSMMSEDKEKDLVVPVRDQASKLVFFNVETGQAQNVQLVTADRKGQLANIHSHVGGVAILGKYIVTGKSFGYQKFDLTKMYQKDGDVFMPVVQQGYSNAAARAQKATWSSLSLDRSVSPNQIITTGWTNRFQKKYTDVYRFDLNKTGTDFATTNGGHRITPTSVYKIKANDLQGVASYKNTTMITSSRAYIKYKDAKGHSHVKHAGKLMWWSPEQNKSKAFRLAGKFKGARLPDSDVESIYVDRLRDKVWSLNENTPKIYKEGYPLIFVFNQPRDAIAPN